jgi:hypothetical protein
MRKAYYLCFCLIFEIISEISAVVETIKLIQETMPDPGNASPKTEQIKPEIEHQRQILELKNFIIFDF